MHKYLKLLLLATITFFSCFSHSTENKNEYQEIYNSISINFEKNNFVKLNEIYNTVRSENSIDENGVWRLQHFYTAFRNIIYARATKFSGDARTTEYKNISSKTYAWADEFTESPAPYIIRSLLFRQKAWDYRGTGTSNLVKSENWALFDGDLFAAWQILQKYKSIASDDPEWFRLLLEIGIGRGWERTQFQETLNDAILTAPYYEPIYYAGIQYFLPQWYGGIGDIEKMANFAVQKTSSKYGERLYATIYSRYFNSIFKDQYEKMIGENLYRVWPRMKIGFEDLIKKYPNNWNLNTFAKFSCLAKDLNSTQAIFNKYNFDMDKKSLDAIWGSESNKIECVKWIKNQ